MMYKPLILALAMAAAFAWTRTTTAFEEPSLASNAWQLDFEYDDPRTLSVTMADGSIRWFWYLSYQVTNATGDDRLFIPEVIIATDAGDILTAGQNVPAAVWPAVKHKLNNPLLQSPAQIVGRLLQGEDYARESVAIWPVAEHDVDQMSIFIGGLSGETATTAHPQTGEPVLVRRSRMLSYITPGTVTNPQNQPVQLLEERDVMR